MYGWLWRHLPGPTPVRLVLAVLLAAVAPYMPFNETTVGE